MIDFARNMIKRAVVTLGGTDDKELPIQQLSYNGKVADAEIIFPYGVHANLSADNNTLCVVFAVDGQEDYRAAMGYTPSLRPKPLAEGEVVFYHPLTQSKIHFRNNGDIDIDVNGENGDLNATIKKDLNITVAGDATIDITGTATVNAPTTNWTGNINVTGNVDIDGDLDVSGATTLSNVVTSAGKNISNNHRHVGSPTAPTGPRSNTGVTI